MPRKDAAHTTDARVFRPHQRGSETHVDLAVDLVRIDPSLNQETSIFVPVRVLASFDWDQPYRNRTASPTSDGAGNLVEDVTCLPGQVAGVAVPGDHDAAQRPEAWLNKTS